MTSRRPALLLRRLATAGLACMGLGAPLAAQDGPRPMVEAGVAITVAVASVPGEAREVRPVRDAQITVSRQPMPSDRVVAAIADDAVAAPGTMLLVLAAMMLWIPGRRR